MVQSSRFSDSSRAHWELATPLIATGTKGEKLIREGKRVHRRIKLFQFHDDKATACASLSHWRIEQEVKLRTHKDEQDEKTLDSCEQVKRDEYEWSYVYFHDISSLPFPTRSKTKYPHSNSYPEWFSGEKGTLAPTLAEIARVPEYIWRDGLSSDRPCVAQIMSWAANRTTTRVKDRAYSFLGLLDGKKAFHCLQLEIIRVSND
ncbi:hypothetical protein V8B97DRAFT_2023054 [Scleroderma yunnanense]